MIFPYGREIEGGYGVLYCSGPRWLGLLFYLGTDPLDVEPMKWIAREARPDLATMVHGLARTHEPALTEARIGRIVFDATSNATHLVPPAFDHALAWAEARETRTQAGHPRA